MPINTTADGNAFTVRARYDGACLGSLTRGGLVPRDRSAGSIGGLCRTITAGYYKAGLARIVGHLTDGYAATGILEIDIDEEDTYTEKGDGQDYHIGKLNT